MRRRLTPEASRTAALEAASALLINQGPQAVTLKAVGDRIGRTHANLLHHFGSAAGLQTALATDIAEKVTATIAEAVTRARAGEGDPRTIVDQTFDAFGKQGAGALASWMILTGNLDALDPILDAIHRLVDELSVGALPGKPVHEHTLSLVLMALGDALLGAPMARALGLPRQAARDLALRQLVESSGLGRADAGKPQTQI